MGATGSANQANISPGLIKSIKLPLPPQELLDDFEIKISTINNYRIIKYIDNTVSYNVATLLHSKLATIEN
jgi:restriction endonuclease S subunit